MRSLGHSGHKDFMVPVVSPDDDDILCQQNVADMSHIVSLTLLNCLERMSRSFRGNENVRCQMSVAITANETSWTCTQAPHPLYSAHLLTPKHL